MATDAAVRPGPGRAIPRWLRGSRGLLAGLGLMIGAVCGLADLAASHPSRVASAEILIGSPSLGGSTQGRDTGQELATEMPTIAVVATSDPVLTQVEALSGYHVSLAGLRSEITVTTVPQSLILGVTVAAGDPSRSVAVARALIGSLPVPVSFGQAGTVTVNTLEAPHVVTRRLAGGTTMAVAIGIGLLAGILLPPTAEAFRRPGTPPRRSRLGPAVPVAIVSATGLLIPSGTGLPVILVAAVIALAVSLADAWYGLMMTLAATILLPTPFSVGVGGTTITIGRVLLFALAVGWFAQSRVGSAGVGSGHTSFDGPLLLLLGATLASVVANLATLSRYELLGGIRSFATYAIDYALLFVITASVLTNRERRLKLLRFLAGLIGFTGALGMVELATRRNIFQLLAPVLPRRIGEQISALAQAAVLNRGQFSRLHSTFEQPLVFASALLLGLPIAMALAMNERSTSRRLAWSLVAVMDGVALLFTASRGAYILGALILVGFLLLGPPGQSRRAVVLAIAAVAGVLLSVPALRTTMLHYFHFKQNGQTEGSVGSRLQGLKDTLPLVSHKPLLGYGAHTFSQDELLRNGLIPPTDHQVLDDAYLLQLAETGVLGLMALLSLIIYGAIAAAQSWRAGRTPEERTVALALLLAVVSWFGMGFFADVYVFNAPPKVFFVVLAAIAVRPAAGPAAERRLTEPALVSL